MKPWLRAAALAEAADVVVAAALSAQMEPRQRVMALAGPAWLAAVAFALSRRARPRQLDRAGFAPAAVLSGSLPVVTNPRVMGRSGAQAYSPGFRRCAQMSGSPPLIILGLPGWDDQRSRIGHGERAVSVSAADDHPRKGCQRS